MSEDACTRLRQQFRSWNVQIETATGNPSDMIIRRAREWYADLIVIGTHGRSGLGRVLLGSVSAVVAREASCSVRIVRKRERPRENTLHLLIGHDGSPEADRVVDAVCRRRWPATAEVKVVSVIEALVTTRADEMAGIADTVHNINTEEHRWLSYLAAEAEGKCARAGLAASSVVIDGHPKDTLVHEAQLWNADTVFLGARGLGLVERLFLGSVSTSVAAHAPCTVELVR
jgi:nucleotide-binding universal stress UspA family protein